MKTILLNSDIDNFIIVAIVGATASIFILKWIKDKLESRQPRLSSFFENEIEDQLDNYTFNFEHNTAQVREFSLRSKVAVIVLSLLIVITPLYEMIETLRPQEVFWGFSCLP